MHLYLCISLDCIDMLLLVVVVVVVVHVLVLVVVFPSLPMRAHDMFIHIETS